MAYFFILMRNLRYQKKTITGTLWSLACGDEKKRDVRNCKLLKLYRSIITNTASRLYTEAVSIRI